MRYPQDSQRYELVVSDSDEGGKVLQIQGRMDASNAGRMMEEAKSLFPDPIPRSLTVDLEGVSYLDDFGALVLAELKDLVTRRKGQFHLKNASEKVHKILTITNFETLGKQGSLAKMRPPSVLTRFGDEVVTHFSDLKYMVSFLGSVCVSLVHVCLHPKSLRGDDAFFYMQKTGVDALPIVGLISFLLGLIMAFMSSVQLQQFGANVYVASLVSLAMTRELGPIMTAIIVAGRSGSAFAAEIGTMKVSEEVDALFTMGFDPTRFLAVPKIIASVIVVPFLTLFSDLFAIMGGLVVGVLMLDLTVLAYMTQTIKTLTLFDVFWGFLKSGVFAFLIAWIGCFRGFQVRGGAASVGQATTSAVVSSIFLIIVVDSVFAVVLRYWG